MVEPMSDETLKRLDEAVCPMPDDTHAPVFVREWKALRERLCRAEEELAYARDESKTFFADATKLQERLRLAETVVEAADNIRARSRPDEEDEERLWNALRAYRAATSRDSEENCIRDRHGNVIMTQEDFESEGGGDE